MDNYDAMINSVSGTHPMVNVFIDTVKKAKQKEVEWVRTLREKGYKAAHPNDGWIDRMHNKLHFAYPQFNDGADIGDLVMLGSFDDENPRPVILVRKESQLLTYFYFEDVKI